MHFKCLHTEQRKNGSKAVRMLLGINCGFSCLILINIFAFAYPVQFHMLLTFI